MPRFKATGFIRMEVVTWIDANSEEEAERQIAELSDRDVSVCTHGAAIYGDESDDEWIPEDACALDNVDNITLKEEDQ